MASPESQAVSVVKRFRFCAAHRLLTHLGECRSLHGHSYELEVHVEGFASRLARASRFSLGLVLMRRGNYLQAVQWMALADPVSDGAHLYFRALGYVALQVPRAYQEAKLLLVELTEKYPTSRYAGPAQLVMKIL